MTRWFPVRHPPTPTRGTTTLCFGSHRGNPDSLSNEDEDPYYRRPPRGLVPWLESESQGMSFGVGQGIGYWYHTVTTLSSVVLDRGNRSHPVQTSRLKGIPVDSIDYGKITTSWRGKRVRVQGTGSVCNRDVCDKLFWLMTRDSLKWILWRVCHVDTYPMTRHPYN